MERLLTALFTVLVSVATPPPTIVHTNSSPQCALLKDNTTTAVTTIGQTREMLAKDNAKLVNASIDAINHNPGAIGLDLANLDRSAMHIAQNISLLESLLADKRYDTLDDGTHDLAMIRDNLKQSLEAQKIALNDITGFAESQHATQMMDAGISPQQIAEWQTGDKPTTTRLHPPNFGDISPTGNAGLMVPDGYRLPKNERLTYFAERTPWFGIALNISGVELQASLPEHEAANLMQIASQGC